MGRKRKTRPKKRRRPRRRTRRWALTDWILPFLLAIILGIYILEKARQQFFPPEEVVSGQPVEVYFTRLDNPFEAVMHLIRSARSSIHVAVFEIDNMKMAMALVDAKERGVDVRVVTDERNARERAVRYLMKKGIPVVLDYRKNFMHDKFAIIDGKYVITGSTNWTDNGFFFNDNNVVIIHSRNIASSYEREFEEMFEEHLFGPESPANTPCCYLLDSIRVEVYFAPEDGVSRHIVKLIDDAEKTVHFMAFSFTSDRIAKAMIRAIGRGVHVSGIMEKRNLTNPHNKYRVLRKAGADVVPDRNPRIMHNKVIVIDSAVVITGSYNFSNNADRYNDENVVIIFDRDIALKYLRYYRWLRISR